MGLRDWIGRLRKTDDSSTKRKSKRSRKKKGEEYENRFVRFYHLNRKRLIKERRKTYKEHAKKGLCVRCNRKAASNRVFCNYHRKKQQEYNAQARAKRKKSKK